MQSVTENNNENVRDLANEIKTEEKHINVSNADNSNPTGVQVDTEKINTVAENTKKDPENAELLHPCLKSRNSCENLFQSEPDKTKKNYQNKSLLKNKSQNSDSNLVTKTGFSKILTWDPWHKIGRNKSKKDKRKNNGNKEKMTVTDHNTGDGPKPILLDKKLEGIDVYQADILETVDDESKYDNLDPKPAKIRKIVRFHADVKVVHYINDEILGHTIEPLKKELEQQERNKELRKEFSPETGLGLKQSLKKSASDYMAAWYKK